ncbi:MAG TPA: hypothetical protein VFV23_04255 [Verrucomicrobiae bacterium]|nr:hypothetical protein [Verrucomicrobiae bacterium]
MAACDREWMTESDKFPVYSFGGADSIANAIGIGIGIRQTDIAGPCEEAALLILLNKMRL